MSGSQWSDELFRGSAMGEMRGKFGAAADVILDGVIAEFGPDRQSTVVDEVLRFREWLRSYSYSAEVLPAEKLHISITVPLGSGQVTIGLDADLSIVTDAGEFRECKPVELMLTANSLMSQCMAVYKQLRGGDAPVKQPPATDGRLPDGERVHVTTLVISNEKGQKRYKVKGGTYTKYGLAVYPERLPAKWAELDYGEWSIEEVAITDGKKVLAWVGGA